MALLSVFVKIVIVSVSLFNETYEVRQLPSPLLSALRTSFPTYTWLVLNRTQLGLGPTVQYGRFL